MGSVVSHLHNQFVASGLLLMGTGSLLALARKVPENIWDAFKRCFTAELQIHNSDPLFDYVTFWLDAQPYTKHSRRLMATTTVRVMGLNDEDASNNPPGAGQDKKPIRVFFSPAPGTHLFWFNRHLLRLQRTLDKPAPTGGQNQIIGPTMREHESYVITIMGRKQILLRGLVQEIVQYGSQPQGGIRLFYSTWGYWQSVGRAHLRSIQSVILQAGVVENLLRDVRNFVGSESWYREFGIPWHRGYLLFGIPGSGKTSMVAALAGELGMDLYLLNIGGSGMDDERLASLMSNIHPGCMILMEDVDCTVPDRDAAPKSGNRVTLSGLLNCLDGIMSREGCLIFMTTNFAEKLDAALLRPGRIDYKLEFGYATEDQKQRLAARIGGIIPEGEMTMTEVQQCLLGGRNGVTYNA